MESCVGTKNIVLCSDYSTLILPCLGLQCVGGIVCYQLRFKTSSSYYYLTTLRPPTAPNRKGFFYPSPGNTLGSFVGLSLEPFTISQTMRSKIQSISDIYIYMYINKNVDIYCITSKHRCI